MKKKHLPLLLALLVVLCALTALAAGGGKDDPLVSLSFLTGSYTNTLDAAIQERLERSDRALAAAASAKLAQSEGGSSGAPAEIRLKSGDSLHAQTGSAYLFLAGTAVLRSGALADATAGRDVPIGETLSLRHRYLAAADSVLVISSPTAVLRCEGGRTCTPSAATDYNAMADALKALHLFRGSFTAFGSGYDLELAPTRIQALIMFLRVLGEEDAALAYTGTTPFTDIAAGTQSQHYVAYALSKGYTNGFTKTQFLPDRALSATQYVEFLLRALGYSSVQESDLSTTMDKALACGMLNQAELQLLHDSTFLRAHLVYLSYYALEATLKDGSGTLAERLLTGGVFTSEEWLCARALVPAPRLS